MSAPDSFAQTRRGCPRTDEAWGAFPGSVGILPAPAGGRVLDGAEELFDGQGLVFPSPTGRVLNHAALTNFSIRCSCCPSPSIP